MIYSSSRRSLRLHGPHVPVPVLDQQHDFGVVQIFRPVYNPNVQLQRRPGIRVLLSQIPGEPFNGLRSGSKHFEQTRRHLATRIVIQHVQNKSLLHSHGNYVICLYSVLNRCGRKLSRAGL
jgi:hypothetical protein